MKAVTLPIDYTDARVEKIHAQIHDFQEEKFKFDRIGLFDGTDDI